MQTDTRERKRQYNAMYYARTQARITFRESELNPSVIAELVETLEETGRHPSDKRVSRLRHLYHRITGEYLPE